MCGRFTNEMTWSQIHALYSLSDEMFPTQSNMQPRHNIAPTQDMDFVHLDKGGNMELDRGRWWLVPFFAKEISKHAMFNARIEGVDTSGAFREAFKSRRCLIPSDGYFEWTKNEEDGGKDPWLLQLPEGCAFQLRWYLGAQRSAVVQTATIAKPALRGNNARLPEASAVRSAAPKSSAHSQQ